jgi:hypothetical protein
VKKPASFTLDAANLLWLKGQAMAGDATVSGIVNRLVTEARLGGRARPESVRSVVGTIRIAESDPDLTGADSAVRDLFERSAARPIVVKEQRAVYRRKPSRRG